MSRVRVHNFSISLDGFATGEGQSLDAPFGHAGHRLHEWMFATRFAREVVLGEPGGTEGVDHAIADRHGPGIGAEIMGAGKFGPPGWQDDPSWRGWWGDDPPFHTPVFVLTHHPRPSFRLSDTQFHFLDATPHEALAVARGAADGRDVRLGGGVATLREFLDADLVDVMHVAVVPVELGRGERLWASADDLDDRFEHEVAPSPSGVTHHLFWRPGLG